MTETANAETSVPAAASPEASPRSEKGIRAIDRAIALVVTWISYASYYLGRKGFGVARAGIVRAFGDRATYGVETAYLGAYAIGQYISGTLGDRVGSRRLITFGMLLSAAALAAFGSASAAVVFIIAFSVNGLAQSTGWPGNVKAMAEWISPANRGAVMGVWCTCVQVGGIVATAVAARALGRFGWRGAFLVPAAVIATVGVLVFALLRPGPNAFTPASSASAAERDAHRRARREAQRRVVRSPTVWFYGASYFSLKLIRYSLLFWLPFYLKTALGYGEVTAGYLSTSFEIGGTVGCITLGFASDRWRRLPRSMFAASSLVGLACAVLLYSRTAASGIVANFLGMALIGALLFGPDALLSGAAAQDAGGPEAAAIAAGIVNAVGSVGAVLQELVTRSVTRIWGWNALFYVFVAAAIWGALMLVPTFRIVRVTTGTDRSAR